MTGSVTSKPISHADDSGFEFAQEMLDGDATAAINFDRLQYHPKFGYIIFEYLLCDEAQTVTPWTSHPNRYWHKNKSKFIALYNAANALKATLFLVNYAKKGTKHEDQVLLIKVNNMNNDGITDDKQKQMSRLEFKEWFRNLNRECLTSPSIL